MKCLLYRVVAIVAGLVAVGLPSAASAQESIKHDVSKDGRTETWVIRQPNVQEPVTRYRQIRFEPGDVVILDVGGCCQTGGLGKTWKRYVDPQGPESDTKYHGLVKIPGITERVRPTTGAGGAGADGLVRFQDLLRRPVKGRAVGTFTVGELRNVPQGDRFLRLGYEDSNYGDNGYYGRDGFFGRDDGTGDQCKGLGDAFVTITIKHKLKHPGVPPIEAKGIDQKAADPKAADPKAADPKAKRPASLDLNKRS
jgi:hypothetical protein